MPLEKLICVYQETDGFETHQTANSEIASPLHIFVLIPCSSLLPGDSTQVCSTSAQCTRPLPSDSPRVYSTHVHLVSFNRVSKHVILQMRLISFFSILDVVIGSSGRKSNVCRNVFSCLWISIMHPFKRSWTATRCANGNGSSICLPQIPGS